MTDSPREHDLRTPGVCQHDLLEPNCTVAVSDTDPFAGHCSVCDVTWTNRAPVQQAVQPRTEPGVCPSDFDQQFRQRYWEAHSAADGSSALGIPCPRCPIGIVRRFPDRKGMKLYCSSCGVIETPGSTGQQPAQSSRLLHELDAALEASLNVAPAVEELQRLIRVLKSAVIERDALKKPASLLRPASDVKSQVVEWDASKNVGAGRYRSAVLAEDYDRLQSAFDAERHAFQNFHRSLCARFGYTHDPVNFRRDLVSLEEHIANQPAQPGSGEVKRYPSTHAAIYMQDTVLAADYDRLQSALAAAQRDRNAQYDRAQRVSQHNSRLWSEREALRDKLAAAQQRTAKPEGQGQCICPNCGLRHGTSSADGGF